MQQVPLLIGPAAEPNRRRVMLKVSGEALMGSQGFGIDPAVLQTVAREVAQAALQGVEVAVVVGGGNFFRGVNRRGGARGATPGAGERAAADSRGAPGAGRARCTEPARPPARGSWPATAGRAGASRRAQSALEGLGVATRVQTAIEMREIAEPYLRRRAIRHLEHGRVVIFGAGARARPRRRQTPLGQVASWGVRTGNPFFTTDTAAALRAAEISADAFFKATKVDGVYDCDPTHNPNAKLHRKLSFRDVMERQLAVMDETAITLCKENSIRVVVFNLTKSGNILRALDHCMISAGREEYHHSWRWATAASSSGGWHCAAAAYPGGLISLPLFGLASIPAWTGPFGSLVATSVLMPKASFLGHLSGILAGYLLASGALAWLGPWPSLGMLAAALLGFAAQAARAGQVALPAGAPGAAALGSCLKPPTSAAADVESGGGGGGGARGVKI
eukprot:scaffold22.g6159.t1